MSDSAVNPWDILSEYFNTHDDKSAINPGAADNILIAWPSLLKGIKLIQHNYTTLHALDYGCGGGGFCEILSKMGYSAIGCDLSVAMIKVAQKNLPNIAFYVSDVDLAHQLPGAPFDLVTSIMVIQFIENSAQFFININKALKLGGLLAFAVFNPDHVTRNHGEGLCFDGFDTPNEPKSGYMCLTKETRIPVFIRTLEEYDDQIIPLGYERIYTEKPGFTSQYLAEYHPSFDTSSPEFLIIVYQKKVDNTGINLKDATFEE